jgi:hypothetical protein
MRGSLRCATDDETVRRLQEQHQRQKQIPFEDDNKNSNYNGKRQIQGSFPFDYAQGQMTTLGSVLLPGVEAEEFAA